ncbi:MAG: iron-sulfur cluster assembly scaffold protein [Patescibacteria group bacterium]
MYSKKVIEHAKYPLNQGKLDDADLVQPGANPLCGDALTIYLKMKDNKVEKVMYESEGCAISQAAASVISDELVGKSADEIKKISTEGMLKLLEIDKLSPSRIKCAVLALETVKVAFTKSIE